MHQPFQPPPLLVSLISLLAAACLQLVRYNVTIMIFVAVVGCWENWLLVVLLLQEETSKS